MPKTSVKLPRDGYAVKFRIIGDTHLHEGTYIEAEGFKKCDGFICYTTCDVDYWNYMSVPKNFDNTKRTDGNGL